LINNVPQSWFHDGVFTQQLTTRDTTHSEQNCHKNMPKKSKAQLEEERLAREEEERKAKIAEEKRLAEEAERKRLEDIRIKEERRVFREGELARLREEQKLSKDQRLDRLVHYRAAESHEVYLYHSI
jgi:hypothetical protein